MTSIVILTGAGISAESGVETFRDPDGIWSRYDYRQVATPEGFAADPDLVHRFYNDRRAQLAAVEPNAAHFALARLEREHDGEVLVITQNIDDLHERAGTTRLLHMHGELNGAKCNACGVQTPTPEILSPDLSCDVCTSRGTIRQDVVWFGEEPYFMPEIMTALTNADIFIAIGTSGNVYPAAGFVEMAAAHGAYTVELNLEESAQTYTFNEAIGGPATRSVPAFVDRILACPSTDAISKKR